MDLQKQKKTVSVLMPTWEIDCFTKYNKSKLLILWYSYTFILWYSISSCTLDFW